jgi:hypothetical protein
MPDETQTLLADWNRPEFFDAFKTGAHYKLTLKEYKNCTLIITVKIICMQKQLAKKLTI